MASSIKTEETTVPATLSYSYDPTSRLIDTEMSSDTPPHEGSMDIGESEEVLLRTGHIDDNLRVAVEGVDLMNGKVRHENALEWDSCLKDFLMDDISMTLYGHDHYDLREVKYTTVYRHRSITPSKLVF